VSYLLDTCVLSELVRPAPDPGVVKWARAHDELEMYISVLTIGELTRGVEKLGKSRRKEQLRRWLEHDLSERFKGRVLPVDSSVAAAWGAMTAAAERVGVTVPAVDGLIAATAAVAGLAVVTLNVADMQATGVRLVNPWSSG
jgi:predicted nucleic acid-binding protein